MIDHRAARRSFAFLALLAAATLLGGCKSTYYSMMETFGKEKRDLLVDNVQEARQSQDAAKKQFQTALERFRAVVGPDAKSAGLQSKYDKLNADLERCEARAADVSKQIADVKEVSADLFKEWEKELNDYKSPDLRRRSQAQLRATQTRYDQLIAVMEKAEASMQPVLTVFKDNVLFLKHNLNAAAIASLQDVATGLEADTAKLVAEMQKSIDEADAFIKTMSDNEAK